VSVKWGRFNKNSSGQIFNTLAEPGRVFMAKTNTPLRTELCQEKFLCGVYCLGLHKRPNSSRRLVH
jgi:hypothetical protein